MRGGRSRTRAGGGGRSAAVVVCDCECFAVAKLWFAMRHSREVLRERIVFLVKQLVGSIIFIV